MNNKKLYFISFTFLFVAGSLIFSKNCLAADDSGQIFWGKIGATTLDRDSNPSGGAVQITAATEGSNVALRFGREFSTHNRGVGRFSAWNLVFTAPFDKNKDLNEIATLDGLANSFSAKFVYNAFRWPGIPEVEKLQDQKLYDEICEIAEKNYYIKHKEKPDKPCDTDFVKVNAFDRYEEFRPLVIKPADRKKLNTWRVLWGGSGAVGYEEFDYLDSTSYEQKDSNETPWSIGAHFGFAPPIQDTPVFITIGYNYQESYRDQNTSIICPDSGGNASATCISGSFGEPNKTEKQLSYIELRGLVSGIGISIKYTYDFENETSGLDMPIYLYRNKSNDLNAGIRFGWNDDSDDFQAGVFAGTSFKLFN